MIKIITKYNELQKDEYVLVCGKCGCSFSFIDLDTNSMNSPSGSIYYIHCPKCNYKFYGYYPDKMF